MKKNAIEAMRRFVLLMVLAAVAAMAGEVSAKKYFDLWGQRASLFEVLPVDSTDIVFVGNSLTHGCEWHELFGMPNIKNRGINGDIVSGIRDRIDAVVKGRPAKIFLIAGVNDISHHITADSIAHDMETLVDYIIKETPGTKIYLESCLPINNDFGKWKNLVGTEQVLIEYNKKLKEIAQSRGITFIDVFGALADEGGRLDPRYTNDGLHLLGEGYLVWRDVLMPYVKE